MTNHIINKLIGRLSWALFGRIINILLFITLNALLARLLSPSSLGAYFLISSVISVGAIVAQGGLNQAIIKIVSSNLSLKKNSERLEAIHWSILITLIISIFVALLSSIYIIPWFSEKQPDFLYITESSVLIGTWLIVFALQGIITEVYRAHHNIKMAIMLGCGGLVTNGFAVIIFVIYMLTTQTIDLEIVIITIIMCIVINLMITAYSHLDWFKLFVNLSKKTLYKLISIAIPIWISSIIFLLLRQIDIWILSTNVSGSDVAIYGAASRLAEFILLPLIIVNAVVPPMIAELHSKKNKEELLNTIQITTSTASIISFIFLLIIICYSKLILEIVYGQYYILGTGVLIVIGIANFINVITGSCGITLIMTGYHNSYMCISLLSITILIILANLFVGFMGIIGVAIAVLIAMLFHNLASMLTSWRKLGIWTGISISGFNTLFQHLKFISKEIDASDRNK